ncbi:MAG: putative alpha/beta hydrolase fold protein [Polyangiaceae bacterium]|nr:putative alpha/beta hydrolase fold protein [Polyangiaceae bacterium]
MDRTGIRTFRTVAADGTEVHAEYVRGASSSTAVLIHGFGENSSAWLDTSAAMSDLCSTLRIDLRGHGDSAASPGGSYHLELYVADVRAVLDHLELERVILIGHSMGAWIAAHIAARWPERARALALVDIGPETDTRTQASIFDGLEQRMRRYATVGEYTNWLLENRQLLTPEAAGVLAQASLRQVDGAYELKIDPALAQRRDLGLRSGFAELEGLLRRVSCPSVVIRGAASAFLTAPVARSIAALLPKCEALTVPRAGHSVMTDNPTAFSRALRAFVTSTL